MIEAIITSPEVAVLHVDYEVLGEQRVPIPEALGEIEAAAEALLLRTLEIGCRAADGRAVDVDAEHQGLAEAGREAGPVAPTRLGADRRGDPARVPKRREVSRV